QPVLHVESGIAREIVRDDGIGQPVRRHSGDPVWLDFQVAALRRNLEADDRGGGRQLVDAAAAVRGRDAGEIRAFVLPRDAALDVEAPRLRSARAVAERLQRDGELGAPAVLGPRGLDVPDGIPVPVEIAFVGYFLIAECAKRIGLKEHTAAAIVERVEDELDVVVLKDVVAVPAHFVGDDPLRLIVETVHREVDGGGVEEDPDVGSLGRRLSFVRLLLHEIADRGNLTVNRVLQEAIEDEWFGETNRPYGDTPLRIPRHDLRRNGGRRPLDRRRTLRERRGRG